MQSPSREAHIGETTSKQLSNGGALCVILSLFSFHSIIENELDVGFDILLIGFHHEFNFDQ